MVPPLEGFWWQDGVAGVDYAHKDSFSNFLKYKDFAVCDGQYVTNEKMNDKKLVHCLDCPLHFCSDGNCSEPGCTFAFRIKKVS